MVKPCSVPPTGWGPLRKEAPCHACNLQVSTIPPLAVPASHRVSHRLHASSCSCSQGQGLPSAPSAARPPRVHRRALCQVAAATAGQQTLAAAAPPYSGPSVSLLEPTAPTSTSSQLLTSLADQPAPAAQMPPGRKAGKKQKPYMYAELRESAAHALDGRVLVEQPKRGRGRPTQIAPVFGRVHYLGPSARPLYFAICYSDGRVERSTYSSLQRRTLLPEGTQLPSDTSFPDPPAAEFDQGLTGQTSTGALDPEQQQIQRLQLVLRDLEALQFEQPTNRIRPGGVQQGGATVDLGQAGAAAGAASSPSGTSGSDSASDLEVGSP